MVNEKDKLANVIAEKMQRDSRGRRDLSSIYGERESFDQCVEYFVRMYKGKVDYVASPESLGFILGSSIAARLGVGFVPMRNGEHSYLYENDAVKASYIDHQDNVRTLKIRKGSIPSGARILLADDWVETAATIQACMTIVEESEGNTVGIASLGLTRHSAAQELADQGILSSLYEEEI